MCIRDRPCIGIISYAIPAAILKLEYDKPLQQALGNKALLEEYCKTLEAFYCVLKLSLIHIYFRHYFIHV